MTSWVLAALVLLLPSPAAPWQRPAGATISGVVLSDDQSPAPIRHARVDLTGSSAQSVVTGDDGGFVFSGLPAGRYEITADKLGVGRRVFSANLSSPVPTPVVLFPGQQLKGLRVILPRGGVIAGRVADAAGVPIERALVSAIERDREIPSSSPKNRPMVSAESDDEGRYRLFGLTPGNYVIRVTPAGGSPASGIGPVETFYPNADSLRDAQAVAVAGREERLGIDVTPRNGRRVRLAGTARDAAGDALDADLRLTRAGAAPGDDDLTAAAKDGTFEFAAVPPGPYTLYASHRVVSSADDKSRATTMTAVQAVEITDFDQTDVALILRSPVTLSGTAQLAPAAPDAAAVGRPRLALTRGDEVFDAVVQANGAFVVSGLTPGMYTLKSVAAAESGAGTWLIDSATLGGRDVLRQPIEIAAAAQTGLLVSMTSDVGGLRGRLSRGDEQGAPEFAIVVMSADRQKWAPGRALIVWPDTNGDWSIDALAAGDYFVAALGDVTPADLAQTAFLEAVAGASVTVTVKARGIAVQDLRVR